MFKGFYQIAAVATVVVLASLGSVSADIVAATTADECKAHAGEATHFLFNGKCYTSDATTEVKKREDLTTAGTCYNRCETDNKCRAPYWDTAATPASCFHFADK